MKLVDRALAVAVMVVLAITSTALDTRETASAANTGEFNAGYIISDSNFYSSSAMSEGEIQAFLNARIGACANGQCLNVIRSNVASRGRAVSDSTGSVRCEAFTGGSALSAATIIYRAQVSCGISAKVILVTLEKEQGLVTKKAPSKAALDRAMGFNCPDTAPCAGDSLGFANQIYKGTLQLKTYRASRFGLQPGVHAIQYKPFTNCGAPAVNVTNYATAALYNYTPYQPNAAALANPYGTGDGCSSYGNRNFFVLYSDWFGSPTGPLNPIGAVDQVAGVRGGVNVRGWTFDYSADNSLRVDVYANGIYQQTINANLPRPDVAAVYPGRSANHGFNTTVAVKTGQKNICLYGINVGPGSNALLGCRTVTVPGGGVSPIGDINSAAVSGSTVSIRGWTFDSDTVAPIKADVYVDGGYGATLLANLPRADVQAAYPYQGPTHGFQGSLPITVGSHQVCVYGINTGVGANSLLGCRTVAVASTTPVGDINSVTGGAAAVSVRGWTFVPGSTSSIVADVYVDGVYRSTVPATLARPDVKAAYPRQSANHGFASSISAIAGAHNVCVYGVNTASGRNALLGCRSVTVTG